MAGLYGVARGFVRFKKNGPLSRPECALEGWEVNCTDYRPPILFAQ